MNGVGLEEQDDRAYMQASGGLGGIGGMGYAGGMGDSRRNIQLDPLGPPGPFGPSSASPGHTHAQVGLSRRKKLP